MHSTMILFYAAAIMAGVQPAGHQPAADNSNSAAQSETANGAASGGQKPSSQNAETDASVSSAPQSIAADGSSQTPGDLPANVCFFAGKISPEQSSNSQAVSANSALASQESNSAASSAPAAPSETHICAADTGRSWKVDSPISLFGEGISISVEIPAMSDVSVGLFDDTSRLVAADETLETHSSLTVARIFPKEPLIPGTRYSIRIDGFTADFPTGVDGSLYAVSKISFRTDGEKPPKPEKKKAVSGKSKGKKGKKRK